MAIFHFAVTSLSRSAGRKLLAAAAYRAGERLRDERTGRLYNFAKRTDVTHKEIMLPSGLDASQIPWAKDRAQLWNAAERVETRRNARVGWEYLISLPTELSVDHRRNLARTFAREVCDRYKVAVDLAIHNPRPNGDARNFHAHLLISSRQIMPTGFGAKAGLDMRWGTAKSLGLIAGGDEIKAMRERLAVLTNESLHNAGLEITVDARSLRAQGIARLPTKRLSWAAWRERHPLYKQSVKRVQDSHLGRVRARAAANSTQRPDIEDVKQQSRDAWLKMRQAAGTAKDHEKKVASEKVSQATADDDLSL